MIVPRRWLRGGAAASPRQGHEQFERLPLQPLANLWIGKYRIVCPLVGAWPGPEQRAWYHLATAKLLEQRSG
jgi:hypothetical protein